MPGGRGDLIRVAGLVTGLAGALAATAGAVTIAVVAETGGADLTSMVTGLKEQAGEGGLVAVHRLPAAGGLDPIQRGRVLARVQSADLVVTVGDRATEFMLSEREKVPVYFVGAASLMRGTWLASPDVAGILPYNVDESLALAQALGLAPIGLAYTSGFTSVADLVEAAARARGVAVVRRVIGARKSVGPAVRELMQEARSIWILGDPLLTRGAGFEFMVEQSLAVGVPVIAPLREEVERGALLAFEPTWAAMAGQAVEHVRKRLGGGIPASGSRVIQAPAAGVFLLHRVLGAPFSRAVPAGTAWRSVP